MIDTRRRNDRFILLLFFLDFVITIALVFFVGKLVIVHEDLLEVACVNNHFLLDHDIDACKGVEHLELEQIIRE